MIPTYVWMGVFFLFGAIFWGVSLWAIIFGGKDLIEIITLENAKIRVKAQAKADAKANAEATPATE